MKTPDDIKRNELGMPPANQVVTNKNPEEEVVKLQMRNIAITVSKDELKLMSDILWHFCDYMCGDDRPDHGLGVLKDYRDIKQNDKNIILSLAGRLRRRFIKLKS